MSDHQFLVFAITAAAFTNKLGIEELSLEGISNIVLPPVKELPTFPFLGS